MFDRLNFSRLKKLVAECNSDQSNEKDIIGESFHLMKQLSTLKQRRGRFAKNTFKELEDFVNDKEIIRQANMYRGPGGDLSEGYTEGHLKGNPLLIIGLISLLVSLARLIMEWRRHKSGYFQGVIEGDDIAG